MTKSECKKLAATLHQALEGKEDLPFYYFMGEKCLINDVRYDAHKTKGFQISVYLGLPFSHEFKWYTCSEEVVREISWQIGVF